MIKRVFSVLVLAMMAMHTAQAETIELSYQAVTHVRESHAAPVLGREDHVVGIAAFRGIAIFAGGDIAVHRYDGWFDLTDGSGPFHGYALWRFDDGSELTAAYEGEARNIGAEGFHVEARIHGVTGTGRFAGASGDGGFSGRRLDPIDKGGSAYLNGTLSLTLPD